MRHSIMGAKGIAFLAGKWNEETKEEAYSQLLKTTRNICSYAAEKNHDGGTGGF